jgi:hypothetical protein
METKLSLLSEANKKKFAESMNEIHDLNYSFEEWILIVESLREQTNFFYGINSQEKVVNN